jgi:hypothetical protein
MKTLNRFFLKSGKIKRFFLLSSLFFISGNIVSQTAGTLSVDKACEDFQIIEQQNRFIDDFLHISNGEQNPWNLPAGIKKNIGNIPFTLAITDIKFNEQWADITLLMRMDLPQKSKSLLFAAEGLKLSFDGDLIGDIKLSLLNDVPVSLGKMGDLAVNSRTHVVLECNGDFRELSLDADVILNPGTFRSTAQGNDTAVVASFRTVIKDWNDLVAELSLPPFTVNGLNGFEFFVSQATLDFSDIRNPLNFQPDPAYTSQYFTLPDPLLWRGLYIDQTSIVFPEWFRKKNSTDRPRLEASHLLIDENGITGDILGYNILSLESGDAGGWPISVTDFRLSFLANNIKGFGFGGEIEIPLSEKNSRLAYSACISGDEYLFTGKFRDTLDISLFGDAQLHVDPTSYLQIELKDRYKQQIAPLMYSWYPLYGISITNRKVDEAGVPPVRAFSVYTGRPDAFPFVYQLPYYYHRDFYELQGKAANVFDKGCDMTPLIPIIIRQYPALNAENYGTLVRYRLPDGTPGTETVINYTHKYW